MQGDLDILLDHALETYTTAEPSPELTGRILRSAQSGTASPAWRRHPAPVFALSVSAAAALMLALVLAFALTVKRGLPNSAAASKQAVAAQFPSPAAAKTRLPAVAVEASAEHPRTFSTAARTEQSAEHKAKRFEQSVPGGFNMAPYSPEELALITFVQQHPKEAAEIAEAQQHDLDPLRQQPVVIPPLQIKPITIPALN